MMPSRILAVASATVLTAGLALVASPAVAADLAEGDQLYVVSTSDGTATLIGVDAATAAGTAVGAGSATSADTQYGGAFDPASGLGYYLATDVAGTALYSVDPATGVSTKIGPLLLGQSGQYLVELAIGPDGAFAVKEGEGALYRVDLATGALTDTGFTVPHIHGLAASPSTGDYYFWDWDARSLSTIDVTDGTITPVGTTSGFRELWSMEIDSNGAFWVLLTSEDGWHLASFTLEDLTITTSGRLTAGETTSFTNPALFIVPEPAPPAPEPGLAASGVDPSGALAAAVILLIAGLGITGARRARPARN